MTQGELYRKPDGTHEQPGETIARLHEEGKSRSEIIADLEANVLPGLPREAIEEFVDIVLPATRLTEAMKSVASGIDELSE